MKLVTWNVQWCCGLDGLVDVERMLATARSLGDFDVLCLQEIAVNYPRLTGQPEGDQAAQIARLLPGFQVFFGAAVDEFDADGQPQRFGNLVATRLPVRQVRHLPLPWPADAGLRSMQRMCTEVTVQASFGATRIMTTHLEYHSATQRNAQALALRALHAEACARASALPAQPNDGSPFQSKAHTPHAILCGDFNAGLDAAEYTAVQQPFGPAASDRLLESWPLVHGMTPRPPTFMLHDKRYGPEPISCDFVFVSASLASRVSDMAIDGDTKVSDHQPVYVELTDD